MIKCGIKIQNDLLAIFSVYHHNFVSPLDLFSYISKVFALYLPQADPKTSFVLNFLFLFLLWNLHTFLKSRKCTQIKLIPLLGKAMLIPLPTHLFNEV